MKDYPKNSFFKSSKFKYKKKILELNQIISDQDKKIMELEIEINNMRSMRNEISLASFTGSSNNFFLNGGENSHECNVIIRLLSFIRIKNALSYVTQIEKIEKLKIISRSIRNGVYEIQGFSDDLGTLRNEFDFLFKENINPIDYEEIEKMLTVTIHTNHS